MRVNRVTLDVTNYDKGRASVVYVIECSPEQFATDGESVGEWAKSRAVQLIGGAKIKSASIRPPRKFVNSLVISIVLEF